MQLWITRQKLEYKAVTTCVSLSKIPVMQRKEFVRSWTSMHHSFPSVPIPAPAGRELLLVLQSHEKQANNATHRCPGLLLPWMDFQMGAGILQSPPQWHRCLQIHLHCLCWVREPTGYCADGFCSLQTICTRRNKTYTGYKIEIKNKKSLPSQYSVIWRCGESISSNHIHFLNLKHKTSIFPQCAAYFILPFLSQRSFNYHDKDCDDLRILLYRIRQKTIETSVLGMAEAGAVLLTGTVLILLFLVSALLKFLMLETTFSVIVAWTIGV